MAIKQKTEKRAQMNILFKDEFQKNLICGLLADGSIPNGSNMSQLAVEILERELNPIVHRQDVWIYSNVYRHENLGEYPFQGGMGAALNTAFGKAMTDGKDYILAAKPYIAFACSIAQEHKLGFHEKVDTMDPRVNLKECWKELKEEAVEAGAHVPKVLDLYFDRSSEQPDVSEVWSWVESTWEELAKRDGSYRQLFRFLSYLTQATWLWPNDPRIRQKFLKVCTEASYARTLAEKPAQVAKLTKLRSLLDEEIERLDKAQYPVPLKELDGHGFEIVSDPATEMIKSLLNEDEHRR